MGIWQYKNKTKYMHISVAMTEHCCFCKNELTNIYEEELKHKKRVYSNKKYIKLCPVCGWWVAVREHCENGKYCGDPTIYKFYAKSAILKKLDLNDISMPIEDVQKYLLAKYEDRFTMSPRLFEEVVASAFRNMGYYARVTAYQNDGGIDVVLDGKDDKLVGVQVKRYKNSIRVSQIREFAGALIENDMTNGIFVTTSNFQSGAYKSVENFAEKGIGIELYNSDRFYDALQIKRINNGSYNEIIDTVLNTKLKLIYYTNGELIAERGGKLY